ncbi:MAG TPA: glycosyltransferase [Marmoricola sp.]|nr:glycosyltransferase [Marmoricola sp.]
MLLGFKPNSDQAPGTARRLVYDDASIWAARAEAVRSARHAFVLLLCGDARLAPHSLDRLVAALQAHQELDACAPRSGGSDHPRRPSIRPTAQLDPSCLLVRRDAPDLVLEGRGRRGRLATIDGARAWHDAGDSCRARVDLAAPLLTLAMIVKNESARLATAIASAGGVVDDIVVYDTGSTDDSREVARAASARVIEGFWDDDFAAARNRALTYVRTPWVVFLDADEELQVDSVEQLREFLTRTSVDSLAVTCRNLGDRGGVNLEFRLVRVLRRGRVRWDLPLHEQVVHHLTGRMTDVVLARYDGLRLLHSGYRSDVMQAKGKLDRNDSVARQHLAAAERDGDSGSLFTALVNAARSSPPTPEGHAQALQWCERAWSLPRRATATPFMLARVTFTGATKAIAAGDGTAARSWRDRFFEITGNTSETQLLDAHIAALAGDRRTAIALTEALPESYLTMYGRPARRADQLPWVLALRLAEGMATEALVAELVSHDVIEVELLPLVAAHDGNPVEMARALTACPAPGMLRSVCGQAIAHPHGSLLLRALHDAAPHDPTPLAAAANLPADTMSLDEAVYWSFALRSARQTEHCPLVKIRDGENAAKAAVACAVLADACADQPSWEMLPERLAAVPAQDEEEVVKLIRTYAPRVAEVLVTA